MDQGLQSARQFLRDEQQRAERSMERSTNKGMQDCTSAALKYLDLYYAAESTNNPEKVRRGAFVYRASNEALRMSKAKEIIERVEPGPNEDPNYFAMLCFEFATLQLTFAGTAETNFDTGKLDKISSRVLLGTVARPKVNAFAKLNSFNGYYVIGLHAAIIDFVYQAAKCVVAATEPTRSQDARSAVQASGDIDWIRNRLGPDHESVSRLYRTLESYFYKGYPRASAYEPISPEHGPGLETLVPLAERWIIGHEFGHSIAAAAGMEFYGAPNNPFHAEEFSADAYATIYTALSGANFDGLPPDFSLAGGDFTLACLAILSRAQGIVLEGEEPSQHGGATHPSPKERSRNNIAIFRQFFNIDGDGQGGFNLQFVLRERAPETHSFGAVHEYRVTFFGQVLFSIWPFVRDKLLKEFKMKRPLHPMWRA